MTERGIPKAKIPNYHGYVLGLIDILGPFAAQWQLAHWLAPQNKYGNPPPTV